MTTHGIKGELKIKVTSDFNRFLREVVYLFIIKGNIFL